MSLFENVLRVKGSWKDKFDFLEIESILSLFCHFCLFSTDLEALYESDQNAFLGEFLDGEEQMGSLTSIRSAVLDFIDEAIEKEMCSSMVLEGVIAQLVENKNESEEGFLRVFSVSNTKNLI